MAAQAKAASFRHESTACDRAEPNLSWDMIFDISNSDREKCPALLSVTDR